MKLQFDANQDYQIQVIDAITGIFEGQPLDEANTSFHIDKEDRLKLISGVGNNLILSEEQIIKNLKITHDHFQGIYDKTPLNFQVCDSKRVSNLRSFATINFNFYYLYETTNIKPV